MTRIEDDCVGCPTYCAHCGADRMPHYYCDKCGEEATLRRYDGKELCEDCLLEQFDIVEGSEW